MIDTILNNAKLNKTMRNEIQSLSSRQLDEILTNQPDDIFLLDVREASEVSICH